MKRIWYIGTVIAALLLTTVYYGVNAQQPNRRGGDGPMGQRFMKKRENIKLNLTDEQKEQMKKAMLEARKEQIQQKADAQVARLELHELLSVKDTPDAVIREKHEQVQRLQNEMSLTRINCRLKMRNILTAEQWERAQKIRNFRGQRMFRRFGGRGGDSRLHLNRQFQRGFKGMGPRSDQPFEGRLHRTRPWGSDSSPNVPDSPEFEEGWFSGGLVEFNDEWESFISISDDMFNEMLSDSDTNEKNE